MAKVMADAMRVLLAWGMEAVDNDIEEHSSRRLHADLQSPSRQAKNSVTVALESLWTVYPSAFLSFLGYRVMVTGQALSGF